MPKRTKKKFLVAQKDANTDEPSTQDIYKFGTVASILQLLRLPDGTVKVLVEGLERAKISHFTENKDFFEAILIMFLIKIFQIKKLMRYLEQQ